jgi:hypothetical protein
MRSLKSDLTPIHPPNSAQQPTNDLQLQTLLQLQKCYQYNVRLSMVPNLLCSLFSLIVFRFFVHAMKQQVARRVAFYSLPLSIKNAFCLYPEHLVHGYLLPRAEQ